MHDLMDCIRPALADRYHVVRELGRGGMAVVFLAEDRRHDRCVVVKVLRPELSSYDSDPIRFAREIRIAASLAHPNILPLLDSGEVDCGTGFSRPYYVTPHMTGESLADRLRREGPLSLAESLRITRAVAAALDYAHRSGVVHRDVKPENILLQDGQPVVADFGVARTSAAAVAADHVSMPGVAVGTPAYMSPEQASGERALDGRSDLYSLACVAYEMLVGEPPFAGSSARATMARHAIEPAAPLRVRRPEVPVAVEAAILRALAKDPAQRFPTAAAFADALVGAMPGAAPGAAPPPESDRTIAVLPFLNATGDPANEYFSDGMTDELIRVLAKVEGLDVIGRSAVFAHRGGTGDVRAIGALLGAALVLEGAVRQAGGRLRIAVRLTRSSDGRLLWAERYDRAPGDLFAVQDEIAQMIVRTLRATVFADLADPEPRRYADLTAYNLYLRGRYCLERRTQDAIAEAIGYFERAIAVDPRFALAYTGLSDAYALQIDYRGAPVAEGMARARAEARRAIALDDSVAEAHNSLAWVEFIYDWDWPAAEREFLRALELNPRYSTAHHWYAWYLVAMGRPDEAIASAYTAAELEPGSDVIRRSIGWLHYYARRYDSAVEHLARAVAMNPTAEENHRVLGLALLRLGRQAEAEAELREALASGGERALSLAALGYATACAGRITEARAMLEELEAMARERYVSPVALATLHAGLGDADGVFAALERAYAERRGWLVYLDIEPLLDGLRTDPRFGALRRRMRLP